MKGNTVYSNRRRGLKRQNATVGNTVLAKVVAPKVTKDQQQDREIKRLKSMVKLSAPPVKSAYVEEQQNPTNAWTAIGLPYPVKGGAADERLGQEIIIKSINYRFTLSVSESDDFDTMRVCIIQYMDGNLVNNFPIGQLTNVFLEPTGSYPVLWPFNTQSASTYRVLFDKNYNLNEAGIAQHSENILLTSKDLAISKVKFDTDAGGALPGLDRGLIIFYVCSDSSASPNPGIEISTKLNFIDT